MPRLASLTSQSLAGLGITRSFPPFTLLGAIPNPYPNAGNAYWGINLQANQDYFAIGIATFSVNSASGEVFIYDWNTREVVRTISNPNNYSTPDNDYFGFYIAMNDTYIAASASLEDTAAASNSGVVYVFNINDGLLVQTLNNPNPVGTAADDNFGNNLAMSQDYLAVGAFAEDAVVGTTIADSGHLYIYNISTWSSVSIPNPTPATNDNFGQIIAMNNLYTVAGVWREPVPATLSGAAYVFDNATGALVQTLTNPNNYDTPNADWFGYAVSASDSYVAVSAPQEDSVFGTGVGAVYVFNTSDWSLRYTVPNPKQNASEAGDQFGTKLVINEQYLYVGAQAAEGTDGQTGAGALYVFEASTGNYVATVDNPNNYGTTLTDYFQTPMPRPDNTLLLGVAELEDVATAVNNGVVYVFQGPA